MIVSPQGWDFVERVRAWLVIAYVPLGIAPPLVCFGYIYNPARTWLYPLPFPILTGLAL